MYQEVGDTNPLIYLASLIYLQLQKGHNLDIPDLFKGIESRDYNGFLKRILIFPPTSGWREQ